MWPFLCFSQQQPHCHLLCKARVLSWAEFLLNLTDSQWGSGSLEGTVHISLWYQHSENQEGMELKRGKGLLLFREEGAGTGRKSPGEASWSSSSSPDHHRTLENKSKFLYFVYSLGESEHRAPSVLNHRRGARGNRATPRVQSPFL